MIIPIEIFNKMSHESQQKILQMENAITDIQKDIKETEEALDKLDRILAE